MKHCVTHKSHTSPAASWRSELSVLDGRDHAGFSVGWMEELVYHRWFVLRNTEKRPGHRWLLKLRLHFTGKGVQRIFCSIESAGSEGDPWLQRRFSQGHRIEISYLMPESMVSFCHSRTRGRRNVIDFTCWPDHGDVTCDFSMAPTAGRRALVRSSAFAAVGSPQAIHHHHGQEPG